VASIVVMPRQGNTVESCVLVGWRVREGARVKADEILCDVETDKAVFEVSAGAAGTVLKLLAAEGDDVPVLTPIAVIGAPGEDWAAALAAAGASPAAPAALPASEEAAQRSDKLDKSEAFVAAARANKSDEGEAFVASGRVAPRGSPRARARAAAEGVEVASLSGTGPGGRVIERDVMAAAASRPPLTAAAKAALLSGGSVPSAGTSIGGRAGLADLASADSLPRLSGSTDAGSGEFSETRLKGVRKLISERMRASLAASAQLTFNASANAERIQALRARFKGSDPELGLAGVTVGDLVLFAVSRVVPRFPACNATLENGVLRTWKRVHLGLAVDTPRGLMVPVIRNADQLSLRQIARESKRLAAACQAGSISPDELSGGTFTVSNLGAFGIESFTPILNVPQVAILGVDAITPRAAPGPNGQVVFEPRMGLSLTVDHQIIDGAPAARILAAVAKAIEDIDLLIMEKD
jgi:pyruvate dehydrogenase E2 component (dihydrolipoamide acetyltransferase)